MPSTGLCSAFWETPIDCGPLQPFGRHDGRRPRGMVTGVGRAAHGMKEQLDLISSRER